MGLRAAAMGGPLEVLELLTPVMSVTVLLFSLAWEELWAVLPGSPYFAGLGHSALTLLIIWVGAVIAFLMVWAEYQVRKGCRGRRPSGPPVRGGWLRDVSRRVVLGSLASSWCGQVPGGGWVGLAAW